MNEQKFREKGNAHFQNAVSNLNSNRIYEASMALASAMYFYDAAGDLDSAEDCRSHLLEILESFKIGKSEFVVFDKYSREAFNNYTPKSDTIESFVNVQLRVFPRLDSRIKTGLLGYRKYLN